MNFLNARMVRLTKDYSNRSDSLPVYTEDVTQQKVYLDMRKESDVKDAKLTVSFGKNNPSPKKLSISAIQYTMNPFHIELDCLKYRGAKPYKTVVLEDLRTIVELEPNTDVLVFRFPFDKNQDKVTLIRFSINYLEY